MAVFRSSNSLALFLLIFGKALGIAGVMVGFVNRTLGGVLLGLDAAFLIAAVVIVLRNMRQESKEADADKEVLKRLVREGALKQYLAEIQEEKREPDAKA